MKYKLIKTNNEITVLTADGGLAEIREVEESSAGDGRQSVTEYYQTHFTKNELLDYEGVHCILGQGKMYYNDWTTPFTNPDHIVDALNWLAPGETEYILDETIWPEWEQNTLLQEVCGEIIHDIMNEDYTALVELLKHVPTEHLMTYLPERLY